MHFRPYYSFQTQKVALFFNFYGITFSFLILIARLTPQPINLITFFSPVLIPITYVMASKTIIYIENNTFEDLQNSLNNQQINLTKLDRIIRLTVLKQTKDQNLTFSQVDNILMKQMNIITQKYQRQSSKNQENHLDKQQEISQRVQDLEQIQINFDDAHSHKNTKKIRKQLKEILKEIFQNTLKSKSGISNARDHAVYFVFLIEIMGSLRQYWILYKNILQKENQFSKQAQIFNSIHNIIYQNKADVLKKDQVSDPFGLNYLSVMQYEKQLEETVKLFDVVIRNKIEVLVKMKQKLINLEELIKEIELFFQNNKKLKSYLNQLTKINSSNNTLYELLHLYLDTLAFADKDIQIPRYTADINRKKIDQQSYIKRNWQQDLYSKYTCVLASTYEESGALTVRNVTQNFYKIFNLKNKEEIINKRVDIIIPSYLQSTHQKYVNHFLEKKCNLKNALYNKQVVFGALSNCHILPLQIDIKVNHLLDQSQFGLTAKITAIDQKKQFILYCPKTYQILGMTQKVSNILGLSSERIIKFKINQLFPLVQESGFVRIRQQINQNSQIFDQEDQDHEYQNHQHNLVKSELKIDNKKRKTNKQPVNQQEISFQEDFLYISKNITEQILSAKKISKSTTSKVKQTAKLENEDLISNFQFLMMNLSVKKVDYQLNQTFCQLEIVNAKQYLIEQNLQAIFYQVKSQIGLYQNQLNNSHLNPLISLETLQTLLTELSKCFENSQTKIQSFSSNVSLGHQNNISDIANNSFQAQNNIAQAPQKDTANFISDIFHSQLFPQQVQQETNSKRQILNPLSIEDVKCNSGDFPSIISQQNENNIDNISKISECQLKQYPPTTRRSLLDKQDDSILQLTADQGIEQDISNLNTYTPREKILSLGEKTSTETQRNQMNQIHSSNKSLLKNNDLNYLQMNDTQNQQTSHNLQHASKFQPKSAKKLTSKNNKQRNSQQAKFNNFQQTFYQEQMNFSDKHNIESLLDKSKIKDKKQLSICRQQTTLNRSKRNQENSTKREKEVLKQILDKQADIQSTSSKKSSYASASRQLNQILSYQHVPLAIKISTSIGIISYFVINILIITQYLTLSSQITQSKQDKFYSTWPIDFQAAVWNLVRDNNIIYAVKGLNDYKFPSSNVKNLFLNNTFYNILETKNIVSELIAQTSGQNANALPFQLLKQLPNTFQIGKYYNQDNITKVSSIVQKYVFYYVNYTTTIHFSIILSYQHTFRYAVGLGTGRPEYYMILNNINFYQSLGSVQQQLLNIQQQRDSDLQDQLVQTMILIIVISGVCIGIIIPLYSYIQQQREDIVTLFSTFSSIKLDDMLEKIQNSYEYHRKQHNLAALKISNFKSEGNKKIAKNISATTKLQRISIPLLFKLLILFGLIIIYPIVNKIVTSNYITQQTIALNTVVNMYKLKGYISHIIAQNYNVVYMQMYPNAKPIMVGNFLNDIKDLVSYIDQYQQDLQDIIDLQPTINRYQQNDYDNFFFQIFKSNMCQVFQNYPQYNSNTTLINNNDCTTVHNGILQKGLQISIKEFLTIYPTLYSIYQIQDPKKYTPLLQKFTASFNIQDFTKFEMILEEVLVSLKNFIFSVSQDYYDYISLIQIWLLLYQICLMTVIFIFGWLQFSFQLHYKLLKTKQYLQVMDIASLLENSYILIFIKKNTSI
ncbi:transmembrane protein, putative (macronuclear) [Tetrahymena thermophila SB210]|uniref:Transmembrane protein, putative n=1 Tax=Tetrahymena thermophila (strain SB210) TaxID=312017 RepID=I7M222_TETTS|nr:transmembrane protein, putative [Tetrahymena thermophila SB210]EAR98334.2 transmembrane protein, putative [Tetrahymena thermophila SB210]|eukprot:XP_001018579.2 transmembrane protein, putative [Tetrahymena thermophila SB210]